jgi:hypothetical protein
MQSDKREREVEEIGLIMLWLTKRCRLRSIDVIARHGNPTPQHVILPNSDINDSQVKAFKKEKKRKEYYDISAGL